MIVMKLMFCRLLIEYHLGPFSVALTQYLRLGVKKRDMFTPNFWRLGRHWHLLASGEGLLLLHAWQKCQQIWVYRERDMVDPLSKNWSILVELLESLHEGEGPHDPVTS